MNVIDMPDDPQQPRRGKTAMERLQEEMQWPLRQWDEIQRSVRQWDETQRSVRQWDEMQRSVRQWEEMQRQIAPIRQLEVMQRQLSPLRELEAMQRSVQQWDEMQRSVRLWEESQQLAGAKAQRMLAQYLPQNPLGLNPDVLRAATDFNALGDAVNAIRQGTEHQEWFNRLQLQATGGLSLHNLVRQLELANPALTALEQAQRSLGSLAGAFRGMDASHFELDEEEEHDAERAAEVITRAATTELTLSAAVAQIVAAIEAQRNPAVRFTLMLFFLKLMDWIMSGIIGAIISQHMPQAVPQSPPQAVKSIKELARATVDSPALLTDYRIVTAKALTVHQNPKALSPKLGNLGFGKVVKLLKKEKDFALVHRRDTESGAEIQGWVFARYLEKFN